MTIATTLRTAHPVPPADRLARITSWIRGSEPNVATRTDNEDHR